jgi:hypothetical protein
MNHHDRVPRGTSVRIYAGSHLIDSNFFSPSQRDKLYISNPSCGKYRKERDLLYPKPVLNRIGCCQAEKQEKSKNCKRTLSSSN